MDRTSAGLLAGWALVLASPVLGVANLSVQWQSCRLDWQLSNAPPDAGGWSHEPGLLGCDTTYGLDDDTTVIVPAPFDASFVLAAVFVAAIALIVVCIRARRTDVHRATYGGAASAATSRRAP